MFWFYIFIQNLKKRDFLISLSCCICFWNIAGCRSSWGQWKVEHKAVSDVRPVSLSMNASRLLVVEKPRLTVLALSEKKPKPKPTLLPSNAEAQHALETPHGTFVVCGRLATGKSGIMEVNRRGVVVRVCDPQQSAAVPCYLSPFDTGSVTKL